MLVNADTMDNLVLSGSVTMIIAIVRSCSKLISIEHQMAYATQVFSDHHGWGSQAFKDAMFYDRALASMISG